MHCMSASGTVCECVDVAIARECGGRVRDVHPHQRVGGSACSHLVAVQCSHLVAVQCSHLVGVRTPISLECSAPISLQCMLSFRWSAPISLEGSACSHPLLASWMLTRLLTRLSGVVGALHTSLPMSTTSCALLTHNSYSTHHSRAPLFVSE